MQKEKNTILSKSTLWIMTIGSGLIVANIYYNQPLLLLIASEFMLTEAEPSRISIWTQVGYALGLLLIVPLGDKLYRKPLILIDLVIVFICLLWIRFASHYWMLMLASFILGITSVVPQLFVPMAAELSDDKKKSSNIGMVMSGLLLGILLSRFFSGFVGEWLGWRQVFGIGAILTVLIWIAIYLRLPNLKPNFEGSYYSLMKSVWVLTKTQPLLRLDSFRGAMGFAGMCAVFTTLVFHLEQAPFNAGASVVGTFGLIGAVGALAAAFVGRLTKTHDVYQIIKYSLLILISSWVFTYYFGNTYWGLALGIILLDLGLQSAHIMNQTDFFSIKVKATNRLNTVYMFSYFVGGSLGTWLAAQAWEVAQWTGVCIVGATCSILALLAHLLFAKKK